MKQAQEIEELKYKIQQLENEAIQIRHELSFSGDNFRRKRRLDCAVGALADRVLELSAALGEAGLRDIDKKKRICEMKKEYIEWDKWGAAVNPIFKYYIGFYIGEL